MRKRLAGRGSIISVLLLAALVLTAVWVTYDAYRRELLHDPLLKAVKQNDADTVQRQLKQGADPNAQDLPAENLTIRQYVERLLHPRRASSAPTALMLAAQKGRQRIAELLIAGGADVNKQTGNGSSALLWAAASGHAGIVRLLLEKGAKPNLLDRTGGSSLLAGANNADVVQLLLEHGANVNAAHDYDNTALMNAAMCGNLKSVQLLAAHGADAKAVRRGGGTALLDAVGGQNPSDSFAIVKCLLEHGADPNAKDHNGLTPLFVASRPNGDVESVRLLLEHKAKVNSRDRQGDTPLHEAVGNVEYDEEEGNLEVVRLLLAHGADPTIKNRLGFTPRMKTPKASPAIRRLLEAAER